MSRVSTDSSSRASAQKTILRGESIVLGCYTGIAVIINSQAKKVAFGS